MSIRKRRKNRSGTDWGYIFDAPGSTRADRRLIGKWGFTTRKEAQDAEATRRVKACEEQHIASVGQNPPATTLGDLLDDFLVRHADERLAPKTAERYRQMVPYLSAELLGAPIEQIRPIDLDREWRRLLASGGHHRRTKAPRPLSAKTVRNIAGLLSSAFSRAEKWGLVAANPVRASDPPVPKKRRGIALTPAEQRLFVDSAPWWLAALLEVDAATGLRRGEILALRWGDIQSGRAIISRSLTQTRVGVEFKCTKSDNPREVSLPSSAVEVLTVHRTKQEEFRQLFGDQYHADLDLIFANPDGTPLKPDSVSSAVSLLSRRLKLPKGVSLHTLRHTHGSHLLVTGMEITAVSERLGHSSPRMTLEVYSHLIRGRDDEAAKRWEEYQNRADVRTGANNKPLSN